jgi:4-hydroxy-tetrahydrodipicolinate synthase
MRSGIFPAVTTEFTEDGRLGHARMERCLSSRMDGGRDGSVAFGLLGEGVRYGAYLNRGQ